MNQLRRIVVVAPYEGTPHLYAGYAKAYIDSLVQYKDRLKTDLLHVASYDDALAKIDTSVDMICFAPSEDRPIESLFAAAHKIKAKFPKALVVSCTEDPRNRLRLREAFSRGGLDYVIHGQSEESLGLLVAAIWFDSGKPLETIGGLKTPAMAFTPEEASTPK